jgi:SAM-dependent methyltransferase
VTVHYESPQAWATSSDPAYEALSRAVVAATPVSLRGRSVLDLGAGTGATSRALDAAGGRPVALDLSAAMLAHGHSSRPPAVVGDMANLPLANASVGGAIAAFSLSHVEDPGAVLAEARRVTVAAGPVIVGVFAENGARHPAKEAVERAAARRGWTPPDWYTHLKTNLEPQVSDGRALAGLAAAAGLAAVGLTEDNVDAGLDTADALVAWRMSGPALADFVASLPRRERDALTVEAVAALGSDVPGLQLRVRILASVVPAAR